MKAFIKWTAIVGASVSAASIAYALVQSARRRIDEGLARAEQVTEDTKRVLASTQQTLENTQQTVRHLRSAVAP